MAGVLLILLGIVSGGPIISGQDSPNQFSAEDFEFFEKQIRPILANRCFECHGPEVDEPTGDLRMDSRESLLDGGATGPAIDPEHPAESLLVQSIQYSGLFEMPPDSKLPAEEITLLTRWVERGAPWPIDTAAAKTKRKTFDLEARRSEHWCWQPIANPPIPRVNNTSWIRQPFDAFILAGLEQKGLSPAPEADKRTLIRRASLDLIGLPPTPGEVEAFLADTSADAYERLVDRLLASPRFGERWARHWMDLVRYAETYGHEYDYPLPYAYQYRDYLIRAFNADVPYDQFVREHIAGDLLPDPRRNSVDRFNESVIATGFWFLGEATHGPVDVRGDEAGRIDNQIDVFGKTFLGLTVACARCHDHMFDAIAARDYYGLVGFMQSSRRQLAMLDYGQEIEKAATILADRQRDLDRHGAAFASRASQLPASEISKYLSAAFQCLAKQGPFSTPKTTRFQGEQFGQSKPSGGRVEAQELTAAGKARWEGDKHLWWQEGKVGDRLELVFSVSGDGTYDLAADFTKASDYGIVKILLDDAVVADNVDLYSTSLGKSGRQVLATRSMTAGPHRLQVELVGANPEAAQKFMFGLDYFELAARTDEWVTSLEGMIDSVAEEQALGHVRLCNWILALSDPRLSEPDHPLHALHEVLRSGGLSDPTARAATLAKLEEQRESALKLRDASTLFADFDDPKLPGWFRTGWAFDDPSTPAWSIDSSQTGGRIVGRAGVVSSGRKGTPLFGVLRSPTFVLDHKFIHYRLAGREAQVRLIIDGFTLDTANSLLFNGMTIGVDSPDRFSWLTQGQDVGNYLGHRAHLEIIDHSGGSVAVDEIRFSDQPSMSDIPSNFGTDVLAEIPENVGLIAADQVSTNGSAQPTLSLLADRLVDRILRAIATDDPDADGSELLDWLMHWDLLDDSAAVTCHETIEKMLLQRRKWLQENRIPAPMFAQAITDGTGENEYVFIRGNHRTLGSEAERRMIDAIPTKESFALTPESGSGRLQLARGVASAENPLTTRVIVNRLWHHLFGRGMVASVDNFGVLGERPSHPELLDHLATSFVEHGWSLKQAIRSMATSATYRMATTMDPAAEQTDPENVAMHRMNVRRLSSEAIRDSILQVAGDLDTTMYGPSVPIYLTPFMEGRGRPGESGPLDGNRRRSVYIEVRRNFLSPMMLAFDTPSPFNAVGRRNVSNVPSQALMLLNHPFVVQQAEVWAKRLLSQESNDVNRLILVFREAYARDPQTVEIEMARSFLESQRRQFVDSGESAERGELLAWRDLCHALINSKEFYFVD